MQVVFVEFGFKLPNPQNAGCAFLVHLNFVRFFQGFELGVTPNQGGYFFVQGTNPGFTGIGLDQVANHGDGYAKIVAIQAMSLELLGDQILARNFGFLFQGVTVDFHNFHAVQKGRLYAGQAVGGRYKENLAEIVIQFQVVVKKGVVLFRIQDLQQSRRNIAAKILPDLVDFIQDHDGVGTARFFDALDNTTRHSANIGSAVTADGGLVVDTAQTHADIFPAQGPGNAFAQGSFANPRRSDQKQNRSLHIGLEFEDRQVFQNTVFDFFESVMIRVQDFLSSFEVKAVFGHRVPRQFQQQFDIIQNHTVIRRGRVHP